ncbi:MAG: BNR-4 repeat-containing protein [Pirellulales bacterium]
MPINSSPRHSLWSTTIRRALAMLALSLAAIAQAEDASFTLQQDSGYRGIWYYNQPTGDEYAYKYSGGMPTYPQQHMPIAVHAPAANKTFFVYGGTTPDNKTLLHMVSYFDHETKSVPRPRILLDKKTTDAHDNPTLNIDADGYLWIFSNSHGTSRPSFIHRSARPYSIDAFQRVTTTNFSYGQPWLLGDGRFLLLHTKYNHAGRKGRGLFWMTSEDGATWTEPAALAHIQQGHYQVSTCSGRRVATALNYHPQQGGLNHRTNLYYLETPDGGATWQSADGRKLDTPLVDVENAALVHDYQAEDLLVYLKEVQFDDQGRPVIVFLTSRGYAPGPDNGPHTWRLARWTGERWRINDITTSDHNYDFGSLYLDDPANWRLIAPTDQGAQPYGTGGQMVDWTSRDSGESWQRVKTLTHDEQFNHSYARRPLAFHRDFAALWGSGNARKPSASALYFTDRAATHVWRLPSEMKGDTAPPEVAW